MPKDNEVDEKVIPDSAAKQVAAYRWRPIGWGVIGYWRVAPPELGRIVIGDDRYEVEELVPAATVAELRAEVERLREQVSYEFSERELATKQRDDAWEREASLKQKADAAERRVGECLKFIDGIRDELHNRRTADWYPEGAHNAAAQMSEDMRLLGNACADFDPYTPTGADPT